LRGYDPSRLDSAGACLPDHPAERVGRDGTAGREPAAGADVHEAVRENVLEAAAETLSDVECGGAWACTARLTGGQGDGVVCEAHEASVGDGDLEARGGEGWEGRVALEMGLPGDVPGDGPDLGVAVLQPSGLAPVVLADGAGDGGEGLHGDKAVGSGGPPGRAGLRPSPARHAGGHVGVGRELPAPGVPDPGATREVGADATLGLGEALEGARRGVDPGGVREALRGAEQGPEGGRDGAGEEPVRPGERWLQVVMPPRLGGLLLALGTVPAATGMLAPVWRATAWALREARSLVSAWAVVESADDRAVRGRQRGLALQGLWGKGGAEIAEGGHGRHPGMRALRRS
jgi:hypothetical protein